MRALEWTIKARVEGIGINQINTRVSYQGLNEQLGVFKRIIQFHCTRF
jgi:hypothetical protein